jgi:hypothetical protein
MISEPALTADEIEVLHTEPGPGPIDRPVSGKSMAAVPAGFRIKDSGVWLVTDDDDKPDTWVCGRLEVIGLTRDRRNESWGWLLQWRDADGHLHSWAMPATALAGDGGELWIMRETFKSEVCRGFDAQAVAKTPVERGHLVTGDGGRLISRRRVGPDSSDQDNRVAVYVIREDILR